MRKENKGFTLIELMIVVTIIGILAVVAGPELMKYQTRAKTTEAVQNVSKIADGARAYYMSELTNQQGDLLNKQFPFSAELSPPNTACNGGAPFKHDPSLLGNIFEVESWQMLQFGVSKPFLYQYEFVSEGEGNAARFTSRALGDLDCDNALSTFEQVGFVDLNNQVVIRQLFRKAELE